MPDKNINLCDTEDEKQRYIFNMLPTYFITQTGVDFNSIIKELTTNLLKTPIRQRSQVAKVFNDLISTPVDNYINIQDINLEQGEMSAEPYQALLRIMGVSPDSKLYEHTEIIDACASQTLSQSVITQFKNYLYCEFGYKNDELHVEMNAESFYMHLLQSFVAHLDAYFYHYECSSSVNPISLGHLFQKKPDPNKLQYDSKTNKFISLGKKGSLFTRTSRTFLQWSQTWLYFQQYKEMPKSTRGISSNIKWPVTNDPEGMHEYYIRRTSEGKWITLMDLYWLLGIEDRTDDEARKALHLRQNNMVKYLKSTDIKALEGFDHNLVGLIWLVYAFFQILYEKSEKSDSNSYITYDDYYYDLWESITDHYESNVSENTKKDRVEWPDYLKEQAIRDERMA
ncbi:hypothetical protein [Psychrobacter sp. LFX-11D]|uniref:hypothetical protein n=1 Tax=Psychrobacter sp. LFX-11D TaxID=458201 RepID=UPI001917FEC1|nr:hypothetical protein [Psychrobacter sp. LFX-11D]